MSYTSFSYLGPARRCRAATVEDAPSIARVVVAAWRLAYADLLPKAFLDSLDPATIQARWQKNIATAAQQFRRVVTENGEVIGACSGGAIRSGDPSPKTAELYSINIHPDFWGQGVGAALLRSAELAMLELRFSDAMLWVLSGNVRAQRFYLTAGWQPDGEQRSTSHLTGTPLHELRFRAPLSAI